MAALAALGHHIGKPVVAVARPQWAILRLPQSRLLVLVAREHRRLYLARQWPTLAAVVAAQTAQDLALVALVVLVAAVRVP
jgi:hypothetical protein